MMKFISILIVYFLFFFSFFSLPSHHYHYCYNKKKTVFFLLFFGSEKCAISLCYCLIIWILILFCLFRCNILYVILGLWFLIICGAFVFYFIFLFQLKVSGLPNINVYSQVICFVFLYIFIFLFLQLFFRLFWCCSTKTLSFITICFF